MVPAQDRPIQERQRSKLPSVVQGRSGVLRPHPPSQARPHRLQQTVQGQSVRELEHRL